MKHIVIALLLLGLVAAAPAANAYSLVVFATGDAFLTISINGGAYWGGPNNGNWMLADRYDFTVNEGDHLDLIFHVANPMSQYNPLDPGGFLAELDLTGATFTNGSSQLLTNTTDWQYSLTDPLQGPTTWHAPGSGWPSPVPGSEISPQTNANSVWDGWERGMVPDISPNAAWLWAPQNFGPDSPPDTWWHTSVVVKPEEKPEPPVPPTPPSVPEPGTLALVAFGAVGLAVARRSRL